MIKRLCLFALALPLLVLGAWVALLSWHYRVAPTYNVVIQAYDPRDLVYGRYLQFRFMWDDPASQKPDGENLPAAGRYYVPERDAYDLQAMLQEPDGKYRFVATASFDGQSAYVRDITIDGRPWKDALAEYRNRPAPGPCSPGQPGCGGQQ